MYTIFYKGKRGHYPLFPTPEQAWEAVENECLDAGLDWQECLEETWCSPRGVEKCLEVRRSKMEKEDYE